MEKDSEKQNYYAFKAYKPLRNNISKLKIDEALYVIWAYMNYLQIEAFEFPADIEILEDFVKERNQPRKMMSEWELETLTKEVIINAQELIYKAKTYKRWNYIASSVNKLKDLEGALNDIYLKQENVLQELYRIMNRQFPWQTLRPDAKSVIRYYKIFGHTELIKIIQSRLGFDINKMYILAMALIGFYLKRPAMKYPADIEIAGFTKEEANEFIKTFSIDLDVLKENLKKENYLDDRYLYNNSLLRQFPLIKMKFDGTECAVAPIPTLLFWRLTAGIYYDLKDDIDFGNAFGKAFEEYVGEVIYKACTNKNIKVIKAEPYKIGRNQKDTIDWIIDDGTSALFIECKTKRMPYAAKVDLEVLKNFEDEIDKLVTIVLQVYKTIRDYRANLYPSYPFDKNKQIYPIILTLEDLYFFDIGIKEEFRRKILDKLKSENIPENWLDDMPYQFCPIKTFEDIAFIIQFRSINDLMSKKVFDKEKIIWSFESYLFSVYPNEMRHANFLFSQEYHDIFESVLEEKAE
jgi:hypothetical protein